MAHFIKLTSREGRHTWYFNTERIRAFSGGEYGSTICSGIVEGDSGDEKEYLLKVKETPEEIIELIQNEGAEMIGAEICYTPEAVAKFLHVSYSTLYRYEKDGTLVPFKVGKKNRYRKSDLLALVSGTPKQE